MQIILITPEFPPINIGGGGVVYENLSKQLVSKKHQVTVIAGNFNNKAIFGSIKDLSVNRCSINFIPLLPFSSKEDLESYTLPTPSGTLRIVKEIIKNRKSVIHLHGYCHPIINISAFVCILMRRKYVLTCHGIPKAPEVSGMVFNAFFKIYLNTIVRIMVRKAAAVTVVSNTLMNECEKKKLVSKKTVVITNGISGELPQLDEDTIKIVEEKYQLKNKKVIFAVGRISPTKGFQFLIDAMAKVSQVIPNAVAIIAGAGAYRSELIEMVNRKGLANYVKLVGRIDEDSKAALYKLCEVVVFPSLDEPFGLVTLEALIMQKPIIAFNTQSSIEIIKKGTGILVPTGDVNELANAIAKIATDEHLRKEIIANVVNSKPVDWSEIVDQYVEIYHKLYL
jgi:glycogen synthase